MNTASADMPFRAGAEAVLQQKEGRSCRYLLFTQNLGQARKTHNPALYRFKDTALLHDCTAPVCVLHSTKHNYPACYPLCTQKKIINDGRIYSFSKVGLRKSLSPIAAGTGKATALHRKSTLVLR